MPRVTVITSRVNPLLLQLRKLTAHADAYRKAGRVWIEGEHLCEAYLEKASGAGVQAVVTKAAWEDPAIRPLASRAESVAVVSGAHMTAVGTLDTPPPLAFSIPWVGAGLLSPGAPSVILDRVQDAGNVGTILRSAAAFGFVQVVALTGTAAPWSPKVMRAGMGAHFALNVVDAADPSALDVLGLPLLATSPHGGRALHEAHLPWPCGWVMGHEGQGLAEALQRRCRDTVRIPQPGGGESLNVASAAAVCMYESARQRLAR